MVNKISIEFGETWSPKAFASKKYSISLESETVGDNGNINKEAERLFNVARDIVNNQKAVDSGLKVSENGNGQQKSLGAVNKDLHKDESSVL